MVEGNSHNYSLDSHNGINEGIVIGVNVSLNGDA